MIEDNKPINHGATIGNHALPDSIMQFFSYDHLPLVLQEVSRPFCSMADHIIATLPRNPERTVALRKLLEARDCALRAFLYE